MKNSRNVTPSRHPLWRGLLVLGCLIAFCAGFTLLSGNGVSAGNGDTTQHPVAETSGPPATRLSATALSQIQALIAEKEARTPEQLKLDSQLIYAAKMRRGEAVANGVNALETDVEIDEKGFTSVEIRAEVTPEILSLIRKQGGTVTRAFAFSETIEARLPIDRIETLAANPGVRFITPPARSLVNRREPVGPPVASPGGVRPPLEQRKALFRKKLEDAMARRTGGNRDDAVTNVGVSTSQGDATHRAADARASYGVNGAGLRIGVLSDSFNSLNAAAADVTNGDLPGPGNPNGFLTPVQLAGSGDTSGSDEGRAMLQIVHDLAPGAQLYFATANNGLSDFANNIRALGGIASSPGPFGNVNPKCDIIIDDVFYFVESGLHDGQPTPSPRNMALITQAVNDVTANGSLYFSSAGNSGNVTQGTAGAWEGDFVAGAIPVVIPGTGDALAWNGTDVGNTITLSSGPITMQWADPLGGSGNDYDLFRLDSTLSTVQASSTNSQTGTEDPFEQVTTALNSRLVVVRRTGAAARFLSLSTNRGRLQYATTGQTRGHSCALNAFGVAATPAAASGGSPTPTGPFPNPFVGTNQIERFSSDGPRRMFFDAAGNAITPGNFLAGTNGGAVRQKPDITAADGVATTLPAGSGLNPFYGTSAAAPHAGAIAALVKQGLGPSATPAQVRGILTSTALDIMAGGTDRDSGAGIVQAFQAVVATGATPRANLALGGVTVTTGNAIIEPNECNSLTITLRNNGAVNATDIAAVLSSSTPGVTVTQSVSGYASLVSAGGTGTNGSAFQISTSNTVTCGTTLNFALTVSYTGGPSPTVLNFTLPVGQISTDYVFTSTSGATIPGTPGNGALISGSQNDDVLVNVPLPGFAFSVYGTNVTSLTADTNGNIRINGAGTSLPSNGTLPSASFPTGSPVLCPYWDDIDLSSSVTIGGGIYTQTVGTAPNRQFVVEWRARHFIDNQTLGNIDTNFAVVFNEGGNQFSYVYALTGAGAFASGVSATVGVQSGTAASFTQFSANTASLAAGQRLSAAIPTSICNSGSGGCSSACAYVVTPTSATIPARSTTGSITVTTGAGCNWTAVSNAPWLTILSGATGSGNGTVQVRATSNESASARVGTLTVASQTVTLTQSRPNASTPGQYRPTNGFVYIRNSNDTGFADNEFFYGTASDLPIAGDWNGDGTDTIGIYRNGQFFLRNSNDTGFADINFAFGTTGDIPIAGDWDGDGIDTVGLVRGNLVFLRNSNTGGAPDVSFAYGNGTDLYIAGDWDGDGIDTIGCFRPTNGFVYLRNTNTTGVADVEFFYGIAGDKPVAGDWNADGIDTIGIVRGNQWFLRNSNTTGFADINYVYGTNTDVPIVGDWNGTP
jgi:hypothetical protein